MRNALQVRAEILDISRVAESVVDMPTRGRKGAMIGAMNEAFGSDENRRLCLSWLFGFGVNDDFSSNSLSAGDWHALSAWIGSWRDDDGEWRVAINFFGEASLVLKAAITEYAVRMFGVSRDGPIVAGVLLPGLKVITECDDQLEPE